MGLISRVSSRTYRDTRALNAHTHIIIFNAALLNGVLVMLAVHNVSPASQRVNTAKSVSKHCSSDSDSEPPIFKHKRLKFDTNYCGLESPLREMNVETENGEISPEEMVNSTPT